MTSSGPARPRSFDSGQYQIRVKGHLADRWSGWFNGLTLTRRSDGTSLLEGPVVDQAALHGLLQKVRDTGLPLVSVTRVEPGPGAGPLVATPFQPSTKGAVR